jgi:dCMP deaminase
MPDPQIAAVPPLKREDVRPVEAKAEPEESRLDIPAHVDSWDEYFLNIAKVASIKSKDPKCPVGAVIVSQDNVVLTTGFNGLPRGVHDDEQTLLNADEKLRVICHAEHNAIMNAARIGVALQGASIFVTKFPCLSCCNSIVQAGIKRIYTHDKEFWNDDPFDADHSRKKRVLHEARIEVDAPYHPAFLPSEQITVPKRRASKKKPGREVSAPLLDGMVTKAE